MTDPLTKDERSQVAQITGLFASLPPAVREEVLSFVGAGARLDDHGLMPSFVLPKEWIGQTVVVQLALPSANAKGDLSFPGIKGTLISESAGGVVVEVRGEGGIRRIAWSKERIQDVSLVVTPLAVGR
jgi:hypothetical protein